MRKITEIREFNVYKFDELSQAAKEKVRNWYLEGQSELSYIFTEDCMERLKELFPNSNLEVQYSLAYCQGDGFNIYGEIRLDELLEKIAENFTEKEMKFFKWAFNEWKHDHKYLTELVMVLCWKTEQHYENNKTYAEVYNELYHKANDYALENLKGEELEYFYRTTD